MDAKTAESHLFAAGYSAISPIEPVKSDIGHYQFKAVLVPIDAPEEVLPQEVKVSFQSDLEKKWDQTTRESIYGGEISPQREAVIYDLARRLGLPAPKITLVTQDTPVPFLLESILPGQPLKEYISSLPTENRNEAYLQAMEKVGDLFAKAHILGGFRHYGDVVGLLPDDVANRNSSYADRLRNVLAYNLGFNGHEEAFSPSELRKIRSSVQAGLQDLKELEATLGMPGPVFVLANLHRGNVLLNEEGEITGISQFNFAQAAPPAAEFYNAFWQFADPEVSPYTLEVHSALMHGYKLQGSKAFFNPDDLVDKKIMNLLTINHFLRATTIYSSKKDDPMRNRWGSRFKSEILFPALEGHLEYDTFSRITSEKWEDKRQ